jgi:hypothetical protein
MASIAISISSGRAWIAGSSIWMYFAPARSRSRASSRTISASARTASRRVGYASL